MSGKIWLKQCALGLRNDFWIGVFFSYQVGMGNVRVESKEASLRKCRNAKISAVSMSDTYWTQICWGHTHMHAQMKHTHLYKYIFGHSWYTPETWSWHSEVKIWKERQKMDFNYPAKFWTIDQATQIKSRKHRCTVLAGALDLDLCGCGCTRVHRWFFAARFGLK